MFHLFPKDALRATEEDLRAQYMVHRQQEADRGQQQGGQAVDPKDKNFEQELLKALKEGSFATRGCCLGNKWARELSKNEKLKTDYQSTQFHERQAFRQDWVKKKLGELRVGKEHSQTYRNIDIKKYNFFTFARIATEFGFAAAPFASLKAARNYCTKCTLMSGHWVRWDSMAEVVLYAFVVVGGKAEFEECWRQYEDEFSHVKNPAGPTAAVPPAAKGGKGGDALSAAQGEVEVKGDGSPGVAGGADVGKDELPGGQGEAAAEANVGSKADEPPSGKGEVAATAQRPLRKGKGKGGSPGKAQITRQVGKSTNNNTFFITLFITVFVKNTGFFTFFITFSSHFSSPSLSFP